MFVLQKIAHMGRMLQIHNSDAQCLCSLLFGLSLAPFHSPLPALDNTLCACEICEWHVDWSMTVRCT